MSARDRTTVWVEPFVFGIDAHSVAPRQHLYRERFVQLEEADVVERETRLLEHPVRRGDRSDAHQLRLDPGEGERDEPHLRFEPELGRRLLRDEKGRGRAVR